MPCDRLSVALLALLFTSLLGPLAHAQQAPQAPAAEAVPPSEDEALAQYLETVFEAFIALEPEWMTQLGIPGADDRWTRRGEEAAAIQFDLAQQTLSRLRQFDADRLGPSARLDLATAIYQGERIIEMYPWRHHQYAITHQYGVHTSLPAFLINQHQIRTLADAQTYLARLESIALPLDDVTQSLLQRADMGYAPPAFTFAQIIEACRNLMTGAPFEPDAPPTALLADFKSKLQVLDLPAEERAVLAARAEVALIGVLKPALERLIAAVESLDERFKDNRGVIALDPSGAFYQEMLVQRTTTDMTAEEIHTLGLRETRRIHDEMRTIMRKVGFEGDLTAFFAFMREDPQFFYPDTPEGRAAYLADAEAKIEAMEAALPRAFKTLPKAELQVRPVEAFREATASKAFYMQPTADGSRPATFYANLSDMSRLPRYQLDALVYHEAVPGHHLQIAIAQELEGISRVRQFAFYTAYSEGWGLYAERLPKEMGFYDDPYADFGRLALELWRAGRLVTDTGLHAKGWSREQATRWLMENTPNSQSDCRSAIDRYIVLPGQATSYMVGSLKILELRERARNALGDAFDIRDFHEVVLTNGPVPLSLLEELVDTYIAEKKGA